MQTYLGIAPRSTEERILRLLVELASQFVNATEGSLLIYDEKKHDLVFAFTTTDGAPAAKLVNRRLAMGQGITGLAALTREVQAGAPIHRMRGGEEHRRGRSPQAVLAAPMLVRDRLVGVLTAVSFQPKRRFTAAQCTLYGRVAAAAAVLVHQNVLLRGDRSAGASREQQEAFAALGRLAAMGPAVMSSVHGVLLGIERIARSRS